MWACPEYRCVGLPCLTQEHERHGLQREECPLELCAAGALGSSGRGVCTECVYFTCGCLGGVILWSQGLASLCCQRGCSKHTKACRPLGWGRGLSSSFEECPVLGVSQSVLSFLLPPELGRQVDGQGRIHRPGARTCKPRLTATPTVPSVPDPALANCVTWGQSLDLSGLQYSERED